MELVLYRNSDLIVVLSKGCINYVKRKVQEKLNSYQILRIQIFLIFQNYLRRERSFHLKGRLD